MVGLGQSRGQPGAEVTMGKDDRWCMGRGNRGHTYSDCMSKYAQMLRVILTQASKYRTNSRGVPLAVHMIIMTNDGGSSIGTTAQYVLQDDVGERRGLGMEGDGVGEEG